MVRNSGSRENAPILFFFVVPEQRTSLGLGRKRGLPVTTLERAQSVRSFLGETLVPLAPIPLAPIPIIYFARPFVALPLGAFFHEPSQRRSRPSDASVAPRLRSLDVLCLVRGILVPLHTHRRSSHENNGGVSDGYRPQKPLCICACTAILQ